MTYASDAIYGHGYSKYDTIQSDVSDMYLEEEETMTEMTSVEEDYFGFAKAIQIDHLTDEQLDEVFNMFGDK